MRKKTIQKQCPQCEMTNVIKYGLTPSKIQLYYCKDCKNRFTESGFSQGRPKINFDCILCGDIALCKQLCVKCYTRQLKLKKNEEK